MRSLSVWRCAWPLVCVLGSCAWSNPDNRPVWRAFEERVVPVEDGWFYSSLPVTVPLGFGAILCDVLVAHPAAVIDDAWYDAKELWDPDKLDFEGEYYTQLAAVPVRAGFTPVAFVGSWLGRAVFDIAPNMDAMSDEELAEREERGALGREERERRAQLRQIQRFERWLARGAERGSKAPSLEVWDPRLEAPLRAALAGDAEERRSLHVGMLRAGMARVGPYDATAALRDPDPVVRYAALQHWPQDGEVSEALEQALRDDPVESVRLRARAVFGR